MIKDDFDLANIESVNFAVALRSDGNRYFVPTDGAIKEALKDVLTATVASCSAVQGHPTHQKLTECSYLIPLPNPRQIVGLRATM